MRAIAALVCAVVAFTAVLLLAGCTRSLWLDEANTVWVAQHGIRGIVALLQHENNLPLYYVLLAAWIRLFGPGEISVRMLPWVFYAASVPAMYLLARFLTKDRYTALIATAFFAGSTNVALHGQNVRMYSLLCLETIVSTFALVRIFNNGGRRALWLTAYVLASAAGAFTHYWFAFVTLAHVAIWMVVFGRARAFAFFGALAAAWAPFAVVWTPSALKQIAGGANAWMERPSLLRLGATVKGFYGPEYWRHAIVIAILLAILLELDKGSLRVRRLATLVSWLRDPPFRLAITGFAVTLLVPFLVSQVKPLYTPHRYTVISVPFAALVLALPLSRYGRGLIASAASLWLLISVATFVYQLSVEEDAPQSDRTAAALLIREARPGDTIIYTGISGAGIEYYLRLRHAAERFTRFYFPAGVGNHPAWIDERALARQEPALAREADSVVETAASSAGATRGQVWVIEGKENRIARILLDRLDSRMRLRRAAPFDTIAYTRILTYAPRQAPVIQRLSGSRGVPGG